MDKTRIYQAGAVICGALCVWIYILVLKADTLYQTVTPWIGQPPWQAYVIRLAVMTGTGILLTAALRSEDRKKQLFFFILTALMVAAYGMVMSYMSYNISYRMQNLCVSLWPFVTYAAASQARQWMKKRYGKDDLRGIWGYVPAVLVLVWFLETKMVSWGTSGRQPMEMLYLLGMGAVSWKMTETDQRQPGSGKTTWAVLILCVAAFLASLLAGGRTMEILESLKNPVTSVTGSRAEINWLGYRAAVFLGAWRGDLSMMEEIYVSRLSRSCPLAWINYTKGPAAMALVLALELGLLYCVVSLAKQEAGKNPGQALPGILAAALIGRTVLGLAADLFLITWSNMGVLLLNNPGDVIIILYLIAWPWEGGREGDWPDSEGLTSGKRNFPRHLQITSTHVK